MRPSIFNFIDSDIESALDVSSSDKSHPKHCPAKTTVNFDKYSQNKINGKYVQFGIQIDGGSKGTSPSLHFTADLIDSAIRHDQSCEPESTAENYQGKGRTEKQRYRVEDLTIRLNTRQLHGLASQLHKYAYQRSNK